MADEAYSQAVAGPRGRTVHRASKVSVRRRQITVRPAFASLTLLTYRKRFGREGQQKVLPVLCDK